MAPTADEFRSPEETVALALRVEAEVNRLREENAELRERIADLEERAVGPLGTPVGRKPAATPADVSRETSRRRGTRS